MLPDSRLPPPENLEVSPAEADEIRRSGLTGVDWVDCREADEWAICRIAGARLVPLAELTAQAAAGAPFPRPVIVYCHHGMRSSHAARCLRRSGWRAWSLAGGIDRWSLEIDAGTPRY